MTPIWYQYSAFTSYNCPKTKHKENECSRHLIILLDIQLHSISSSGFEVLCMLSHCHTGQSNYIINHVVLYVQDIINCTPLSPLLKSKGLKKLEWLVPALSFHSVFRTTASRLSQWEGEVSICTGIYSLHYCEVVHTSYSSTDWFWFTLKWVGSEVVGNLSSRSVGHVQKGWSSVEKNTLLILFIPFCAEKKLDFPIKFIHSDLSSIPTTPNLHCDI